MSKEFYVGQSVQLSTLPPYVKTADPMPMLRPASVLQLGETGVILSRHPGGYWAIRFATGAFLLDDQYLDASPPN
jgi:hypothetical protein